MKINFGSKKDTRTFYLLLLLVITLPVKNNLNSISIILLSVFSFVTFLQTKKFDTKVFYKLAPLLLVFLWALISVSYSENFKNATKLISRLLPLLLFPFAFSIINIKRKHFNLLLKIFVGWMTVLCLYSHTMVLLKLYRNNDILFNVFNSYYSYTSLANDTIGLHSTYYAYYVIIAIVFLVYFLFKEKSIIVKIAYFLLLFYLSFFVLHLSARTPIFVLFLFYNFSILYYFFKRKEVLKGVFFLVALYILTSVTLYNVRVTRYRFQQLFGFTYANGYHHDDGTDKILQWKAAIIANNNVLFGNGIGDANDAIFQSYRDLNLKYFADKKYNAHNQFVQTYVGQGLIGLSIILLLFFFYFKLFYKNSFFLGYVLIGISFILFQTESYLERHNGVAMFTILICLFANQLKETKQDQKN